MHMCPPLCRWRSAHWTTYWSTSWRRQSTASVPTLHLSPMTLGLVRLNTALWETNEDPATPINNCFALTVAAPPPMCVNNPPPIVPRAQVAPMQRSQTTDKLLPPEPKQDDGDYYAIPEDPMIDDHKMKKGKNKDKSACTLSKDV